MVYKPTSGAILSGCVDAQFLGIVLEEQQETTNFILLVDEFAANLSIGNEQTHLD